MQDVDAGVVGMDVASEITRRSPQEEPMMHSLTMPPKGRDMNWTTPSYKELRLGFEITMYIANR
ncbi:hypothetical protein CS8_098370 [Cupriavidus sp. 8B]